jgi:hypothetical protein
MRRKSIILASVGLSAAALVGTAGYASAQDSGRRRARAPAASSSAPTLSDVQKLQADHLTLVGDRLRC